MASKSLPLLIALAVTLASSIECAKILFLEPTVTKSVRIFFMPLAEELAKRGHDVTVICPFKPTDKIPNLNQVDLPGVHELINDLSGDIFEQANSNPIYQNQILFAEMVDFCRMILQEKVIVDFMSKGKQFDLVFVEGIANECALSIAYIMGHNVAFLASMGYTSWNMQTFSNPVPASILPQSFLSYPGRMNFIERGMNSIGTTVIATLREFFMIRPTQRVLDELAPSAPSIQEAENQLRLLLVSADPVFSVMLPTMPNIIKVGAIHCHPANPLPKELEDFVQGSGDDGFIMFGLGSFVPAHRMPLEMRDAFVTAFSRLRQRVIWKFDGKIDNLPKNVKLVSWMPQQDLLGHPKIRLFITHSGLLSMQESVYHGVPVIGLPIFADQPGNIARGVELGFADKLDVSTITADIVYEKVTNMLNDKRYSENAKRYSVIMKDQPETPLERAVYWTEYVIRHKGAPHLRNQAADELNMFQYYLLDVISVVALTLAVFAYVAIKIIKLACTMAMKLLFSNDQKLKSN